jgi:hypothetical protein
LAIKTYPAVQEFHANVKDFVHKRGISLISHGSHQPRQFVSDCTMAAFRAIADMIETFLRPSFALSAYARIVLWGVLSNPPLFAALVLPHFYDSDTLDLLTPDKQHTDGLFSELTSRRLPALSSSYPLFHQLWLDIHNRKKTLRQIRCILKDDFKRLLQHVTVHRVRDDEGSAELMNKKVVLDPQNPSIFSDSEFLTMTSETSFIVGDTSDGPVQIHLFVDEQQCCGVSDARIIEILFQKGGNRGQLMKDDKSWFVGAHVVNLHRIKQIRSFMDDASPTLLCSAKELRCVKRSDIREDPDIRNMDGSRMFEVGSGNRVDQVGCLQSPHNFKKLAAEEMMKYDLLADNDYILDVVKAVNRLAFGANFRLLMGVFRFSRNSGGSKQTSITAYLLVYPHVQSELTQCAAQVYLGFLSPGCLLLTTLN